MNNLPIKKIDQVDRYGNKVSMEWDNSYLKKKRTQDKLGNAFTIEYAIPEVPEMGEQDVPKYSSINREEAIKNWQHMMAANHPGEPRGTDQIPAWLTEGEFVVNKEATDMYEPLIRQINNHGRQIQKQKAMYASDGTKVSWITDDLLDKLRFAETSNLPTNKMISPRGAVGPYQIMPLNFDGGAGFGTTPISAADAWDPIKARQFAREYLTGIQRHFPDWSPEEVLRAYNWGPGNMRAWKKPNSDVTMPIETQQYSSKILGPGKSYADASSGGVGASIPVSEANIPPKNNIPPKKEGFNIWSWLNPIGTAYAEVPNANTNEIPKIVPVSDNNASNNKPMFPWAKNFEDKGKTVGLDRLEAPKPSLLDMSMHNIDFHNFELGKQQLRELFINGVIDEDKYNEHLTTLIAWKTKGKKQEERIERKKEEKFQNKVKKEETKLEKLKKLRENTDNDELKTGLDEAITSQNEKVEEIKESNKPVVTSPEDKADLIKTLMENVKQDKDNRGDSPDLTNEQKDAATNAGNNASKKEKSKAEEFLRGLLGPLFNKPELKRMAIFYAGARAMGYNHGPSLLFSLENYIKRVDGLEDAARTFVYSAAGQEHTDESLKNFMQNDYDMSLLVDKKKPLRPTANYVTAFNKTNFNDSRKLELMESGTGETKSTYHRDLKTNRIVGDKFWEKYTTNSLYSKKSDKYQPYLNKMTETFEKTLQDAREKFEGSGQANVRNRYDKLNLWDQAQTIAKWVMDQGPLDPELKTGVEPNAVGGILDEAFTAAMADAVNNKLEIHDIMPYVKYSFFTTKTRYADLFLTKMDTDKEFRTNRREPVSMRQFDTLKDEVSTYVRGLTEEVEPGKYRQPFLMLDEDEAFNLFIDLSVEKWKALGPDGQESFDRKVVKNKKGIAVTSPFFEFVKSRLFLNMSGGDI